MAALPQEQMRALTLTMKNTLIAATTVAGPATAAQADEKRLVTVITSPDA